MLILNNNNIFSILFFDFCDCRFYHLKELCHLLRSTNSFEAEAGRRILLSNQYRIESLSLSHTSIIIVVFICLSIGVRS